MSIKERLTTLLFGQRPQGRAVEDAHAETHTHTTVEDIPNTFNMEYFNQTLLELPEEHQIYHLYNQRRREVGYLPSPRICLDEDGVIPQDVVQKEKRRLRSVLTGACNARLKALREQNLNSAKKQPPKKGADQNQDRGKTGISKKSVEPADGPSALDALPTFFLSADKLYAWLIVFPPAKGGKELTRDILYQALMEHKISYGVDIRLIDGLPHDERRYFNLFLIAKGKPAFDGKNGNIVDNFPRVIQRVLETDEFDQVNYRELNLIYNVEQGQEICHLIKPTEGEPGRSVLDEEIPAKSGKAVPLPKGRNTEISEDGIQLLATIAGSVEFTGRSFQVKPVLNIPGDVDFSTGNLSFLGDINIYGNIRSGFTVRAMGNIHVGGIVEAGSIVESGGDLVVVRGILGNGTTTVQSHRCVFSKYIENAIVSARENVQADCIIGSNIYCCGEVLVKSGRGCIMGGRVWTAKKICANAVGSHSECKTFVAIGGDPCANFEWEVTQKEAHTLEMELEKLECQPDSPVKTSLLEKTKIKLATANLKLRQLEERLENVEPEPSPTEKKEAGRLECGIVYPGTKIRIGEEVMQLRQAARYCVITMVDDEIVIL